MNIQVKTDTELLKLWETLYDFSDVNATGASKETYILSLIYRELCERGYKSQQGAWKKEGKAEN